MACVLLNMFMFENYSMSVLILLTISILASHPKMDFYSMSVGMLQQKLDSYTWLKTQ